MMMKMAKTVFEDSPVKAEFELGGVQMIVSKLAQNYTDVHAEVFSSVSSAFHVPSRPVILWDVEFICTKSGEKTTISGPQEIVMAVMEKLQK